MQLTNFPQEIIDEYKLNDIVNANGLVYMEIRKALYEICHSGALAAKKLAVDLKPYGYYKVPKMYGLWRHKSRPISFTLVVDNFSVSYVDRADAEHLKAALKVHYPMTVDWSRDKYIGTTLDWNYTKQEKMRS